MSDFTSEKSFALSAGLSAIREDSAATESRSYLDPCHDAGFRPGMGIVIPDRFFWALPPGEVEEGQGEASLDSPTTDDDNLPKDPRHVH